MEVFRLCIAESVRSDVELSIKIIIVYSYVVHSFSVRAAGQFIQYQLKVWTLLVEVNEKMTTNNPNAHFYIINNKLQTSLNRFIGSTNLSSQEGLLLTTIVQLSLINIQYSTYIHIKQFTVCLV